MRSLDPPPIGHSPRSCVIAVDGASGVGKSTLLRGLSKRYGCDAVEFGVVVRAVAWLAQHRGTSVATAVAELTRMDTRGRLVLTRSPASDLSATAVRVDGHHLGLQLFADGLGDTLADAAADPEATAWVSAFVRERLRGRRAALSGREVGRVVCPEAPLKVRLTATAEVRALRKCAQRAAAGLPPSWIDDASPAPPRAPGQFALDTTTLTPAEVLARVAQIVEATLGWSVVEHYAERSRPLNPRARAASAEDRAILLTLP
jgi:CMP/dCMP kinase